MFETERVQKSCHIEMAYSLCPPSKCCVEVNGADIENIGNALVDISPRSNTWVEDGWIAQVRILCEGTTMSLARSSKVAF